MLETLGVTPGSVTAFALINDTRPQGEVRARRSPGRGGGQVNFHPLANTATTSVSQAGFRRFLEIIGVAPIGSSISPG